MKQTKTILAVILLVVLVGCGENILVKTMI